MIHPARPCGSRPALAAVRRGGLTSPPALPRPVEPAIIPGDRRQCGFSSGVLWCPYRGVAQPG